MFSKTCKYAIRAVLFLATNTDEETKMGAEDIAAELLISKPFLAKILQQLSKRNIISSSKGRNGGFYLSSQNRSANLRAVIETIDGQGVLTDCVLGLDNCSNDNPCPYHFSAQQYRTAFLQQLQNETIEESARRIAEQDLKLKNAD